MKQQLLTLAVAYAAWRYIRYRRHSAQLIRECKAGGSL